ncbi:hypothetical protein NUW54_g12341 [Trametes sanguinea]|uniref:Uncharacterized protein n=1 Tax=Trametes sanguinea TaxID=158606 RepID=A0ACC1MZQ7_9APHY|nr:hypothetical protein NUW54_g12341 [Trametes sanguinea]
MSNVPEPQDVKTTAPLALPPPPPEDADAEKITINGSQTFKFDKLGPVVVNSDGTLSRIANWENMAPVEKERTLRLLVARNQVRIANQEKQQSAADGEQLSISKNTHIGEHLYHTMDHTNINVLYTAPERAGSGFTQAQNEGAVMAKSFPDFPVPCSTHVVISRLSKAVATVELCTAN